MQNSENDGDQKPKEFVEALAKGLAIIESFDADHGEMTLSEVSRRVGLSPAAARRSLLTMKHLGYVGQREKRFHLRPRVMSLGSAFYFSARIDEVLQPELRNLVSTFGDASSVGTLQGMDVLYIAHYSENRSRRPSAVVGARYPAYATSLGRILLAALPAEELEIYLANLKPVALTHQTLTDIDELRTTIREAGEKGFTTTVDQLDYGITALAVPIRSSGGQTIAALNISGYSGMLTAEGLVKDRLEHLRAASAGISSAISRFPMVSSIIATR
ncbi:MAG: IclR family transcriptional regulator [Hyphomicrobiales bacterium]|nr:MAG: IclR family transcriptional regulator [Hyphomicrobiales bacterium]